MIIKMKKAKLVVLKNDKDKLLKSLQKHSVLMIIKNEEMKVNNFQDPELQRAEKSLGFISKFKKKSFVRQIQNVSYEEFVGNSSSNKEYLEKVETINQELSDLELANNHLKEEIDFYSPWTSLDMKLSDVLNTKETIVHTGFISTYKIELLETILNNYQSPYQIMNNRESLRSVIFFNYHSDDKQVMEELRSLELLEVELPKIAGTALEIFEEKIRFLEQNNSKIFELNEELKMLANDSFKLELLNDQLASHNELEKMKSEVNETMETVYIEGWFRVDKEKVLHKAIEEATDLYDLIISEPEDGEVAPTVTKNNKFVDSFESVTDMFAIPSQEDIDPNPSMSVWFWIIYGMMMGDAVYGLLMILVFGLLIKIKKPKGNMLRIFRMFMYSGITTIIWGVLFGSYLGYEYKPFISPINDVLNFMILSLAIGGLHIITGILIKAYQNIKNGDLVSALVDNITWILIIAGIGLFAIPTVQKVGIGLIITGAAIIILFGGRGGKGLFKKAIGGFGKLYGVVNYASDILSYSRILALALSTAVISMVMNMLAGMVLGIPYAGILFYVIVLTIGHVFNIAMGLLSAYVHDSRLQYIEFFGKFYEGGGYIFEPLSYKLNYIDNVTINSHD